MIVTRRRSPSRLLGAIILLALVRGCYQRIVSNTYCGRKPLSDELHFTADLSGADFAVKGNMKLLYCCATGYNELIWYKKINGRFRSFPWYINRTIETWHSNQTLYIEKISLQKDKGLYKCVAKQTKTGKSIENVVNITVIGCESTGRNPWIKDKPYSKFARVGDNVTFQCSGFFGCDDLKFEFADVYWITKVGKGFKRMNDLKGFSVQYFKDRSRSIIGANLTIINIQEAQFDKFFCCHLSTPHNNYPVIPVQVNHFPQNPDNLTPKILVPVAVIIFILILLVVIVNILIGPQIRYYFKCYTSSVIATYNYDVILIYNDTAIERDFVMHHLEPKLEEFKYKVCIPETHGPTNQTPAEVLMNGIQNSLRAVILRSSTDSGNLVPEFNLENALSGGDQKVVFIDLPSFPKESRNVFNGKEYDGMIGQRMKSSLRWSELASRRELKNFWCRLQLQLPFVHHTKYRSNCCRNLPDEDDTCETMITTLDRL